MAGSVWEVPIKFKGDMSDIERQTDQLKKGLKDGFTIDIGVDKAKVEKVISDLDKMLTNLGKGTGDFKQFEKLSDELKNIKKSLGGIDDKGVSNLYNSINNIDKALSSLTEKLQVVKKDANGNIVNTSQIGELANLFVKIEEHLNSIHKSFGEVGKDKGLSPLINQVNELKQAMSGLKLNFNLDLGNNTLLDKQIESKSVNLLSAYRNLFKQLNMNSSGALNQQINEFLNGFDNKKSVTEQNALYANFLKQIRNQAKALNINGNDYVKDWAGKEYWSAVSGAKAALTKAEKAGSSTGDELKNIFGGSETDLTGVISQLEAIANKLDTIASSAKTMGEAFSSGLNVSASLEDITKLTERVKELETELQKVKSTGGISGDKTDLSLGGTKQKYPNAKRVSEDEYNKNYKSYADSANKYIKSLNAEVLGGSVDVKFVDGLAQVNAKIKEADGSWKTFSAKVDADGNILGQRVKAVTKDVNQLDAELKNFGKDTPKIFDASKQKEWLDSFNVLKELQKRSSGLNNLYANNTNGKNDFAIQELRKEIQALEPEAEKAKQTINSIGTSAEALSKVGISAKQGAEAIELMSNAAKGSSKSIVSAVTTYEKFLNSANTNLAKFQKQKPMSNTFSDNVTKLEGEITKYSNLLKQVKANGGIATKEENEQLNTYRNTISKLTTDIKEMAAAEKGAKEPGLSKIFKEISELRDKYSGMGKEFKRELDAIEFQFRKSGDSLNLADAKKQLVDFEAQLIRTGNNSKSMFDAIKNKAFYGLAGQIAGMVSLYDVINVGKQAINQIIELDTALVDLQKTTTMSSSQLNQFYYDANDVAKQMGVTTQEIIEQASAWSRLGYSSAEAATQMAQLSSQFASISPGMETSDAQEGLVSIMKAWNIGVDDVKSEIMDKINILGRCMPKHVVIHGAVVIAA